MSATKRVRDFIDTINKTYKGEVAALGGEFGPLNLGRFSSGILSFDVALGGGWPVGRIILLAGMESTGKTYKAIKACAQIEEYDHLSKMHKDYCEEADFSPGTALYVDAEGDFDIDWAVANGFNPDHHVVVRPEYGEQAVDIIATAIQDNVFDLIVADSIAAMTPTKEIEESAEDQQMGLHARMINKAMRRWNSGLLKLNQSGQVGPTLICLNQFRMKIGVMFGDPRTTPGGMGQRFCSSIIIYTKSGKYDDTKDTEAGKVILGGVCHKNKTYVPKMNFSYELALRDGSDIHKGDVNNISQMMALGKKHKLIIIGKGARFGAVECRSQKEFMTRLEGSPILQRQLWRSIIKAAVK